MGAKKTPFNIFKEKFDNRSNGEYEYIQGYNGMSKKIKIRHISCGHEFEVVASAFINTKTTCKKCSIVTIGKQKKEKYDDENKKYIENITNGEYELIKYNGYGSKTKSVFKHNVCGHIFEKRYDFFKDRGYRCPKCSRKHSRYTKDEFKKIFPNQNIEILDIIYPDKKVKIKCLLCNTISVITFETYKNYKFSCCKKERKRQILLEKQNKKKEKELVKEQLIIQKRENKFNKHFNDFKSIHGNSITILEKVYNTSDFFKVKCNTCNSIWSTTFKRLKQGKGCPICKISKGEREINNYLTKNNYIYKREYKIKNSEIESLRFDFAVFINKELYLIEFDGKQHFSERDQFGDLNQKEKFEKTKANDKRKNNYCKKHNIKLLRIPYYKIKEIPILLENFLK